MGNTGKGVVIPFPGARASLWPAQREWMHTSGPFRRLSTWFVEVLDRAERDLDAVEDSHEALHPAPARLGSFVRGELTREDNRAVVRHLLTDCPSCAAVLRPLLG